MVCTIRMYEKPELRDPVLIEGLPGIGFVANIATSHLIQELNAKLFSEIHSSSFQDFAITEEDGKAHLPINNLYYHKRKNGRRDLVILHGNTQALTTVGQYELCGRILDIAEELGCRYIITLGGLKREEKSSTPRIYCAASDPETLKEALSFGVETIEGRVFGVAGLLIGLGKLRGMRGFCLLGETSGVFPDPKAALEVLKIVCKILQLKVDVGRLYTVAETTRSLLRSFDTFTRPTEERIRKQTRFRWLV